MGHRQKWVSGKKLGQREKWVVAKNGSLTKNDYRWHISTETQNRPRPIFPQRPIRNQHWQVLTEVLPRNVTTGMNMAAVIGVPVSDLERMIIGSSDIARYNGIVREVVEDAVVPCFFSVELDESVLF